MPKIWHAKKEDVYAQGSQQANTRNHQSRIAVFWKNHLFCTAVITKCRRKKATQRGWKNLDFNRHETAKTKNWRAKNGTDYRLFRNDRAVGSRDYIFAQPPQHLITSKENSVKNHTIPIILPSKFACGIILRWLNFHYTPSLATRSV